MEATKYFRMVDLASIRGVKDGVLPVGEGTIRNWIRAGFFPKPIKIGPGCAVWREDTVTQWLRDREQSAA